MMKNIQIRPLSIDDYDALYALWRSALPISACWA